MEEKVNAILDDLRPFLNGEGGDVELVKIEDNYVYIKLTGACAHCGYQDDTINFGIENYLKEQIPEIEGVINVAL